MSSHSHLMTDLGHELEVLEELEDLHADLLQFVFEWETEQRSLPSQAQDSLLEQMSDLDLLTGARPLGSA